jgi:hypothetical protein
MIYIPQRIELADGTKCVSLEDYDKLATENMLEVNKICKERDAVIKELKEAWLAMDEIEGTDRMNEWQNKNAHFLNTDT